MKVLLVTNQYVDIRPDGCYCNFALSGTLQNISILGELFIAAAKLSPKKPAAQPVNRKIEFIDKEHVRHFKPLTSSVREYFANTSYNRKVLEEMIPNVDLVIAYSPGNNIDLAFKIARKHNVPYMTFLVACPWDIMHTHQRLLVRMLAPVYYYRTKKFVENSEYVHYVTNSFLQKRYPTKGKSLGCSDVNLGQLDSQALQARMEKISAKTPSDPIKLVTTGHTNIRYKGQEYVIRGIADLMKRGDNRYHYYLIGGGEGIFLKKLCAQLGVEQNVHFLGRKTPEEVMDILKDADIYIQPSLTEGLPRAVVEAMSVALPCIGFETGGIPELLEPAFLVQKKDVEGIVMSIRKLEDKGCYKANAMRNFNVAREYEHSLLSSRIRNFFLEIKDELKKRK